MNKLLRHAIPTAFGIAALAALGGCAQQGDYVKPTSTTAKTSESPPAQSAPGAQDTSPAQTAPPAAGRHAAPEARPAAPGVDG